MQDAFNHLCIPQCLLLLPCVKLCSSLWGYSSEQNRQKSLPSESLAHTRVHTQTHTHKWCQVLQRKIGQWRKMGSARVGGQGGVMFAVLSKAVKEDLPDCIKEWPEGVGGGSHVDILGEECSREKEQQVLIPWDYSWPLQGEQISRSDWSTVNNGMSARRGQRIRGRKGSIMEGPVDHYKNFDFDSAFKSVQSINSSEDWYDLYKLAFFFWSTIFSLILNLNCVTRLVLDATEFPTLSDLLANISKEDKSRRAQEAHVPSKVKMNLWGVSPHPKTNLAGYTEVFLKTAAQWKETDRWADGGAINSNLFHSLQLKWAFQNQNSWPFIL